MTSAWKHRGLFLVVLAVFVGLSVFTAASVADSSSYQAEALVVIQDPNASEVGGTSERYISESIAIMRSPIIANAAAEDLQETNPELEITAGDLLTTPFIGQVADSSLVVAGTP